MSPLLHFWDLKKVSWIALLSTANFEQVIIINYFANFKQVIIHSADFEQVELKLSFCWLWTRQNSFSRLSTNQKKPTAKLSWEKPDVYAFSFLFRPLPYVTSTPPWLLRPIRVSTSSELYPDTCLFFWMHRHSVF